MPNRIIKESIKLSNEIDKLSWFEEVMFYRLMVTADDYGCLDGRSAVLKSLLFPTKENVTKKAIEDALGKLISVGLVERYTVGESPYIHLLTWNKHQRLRDSKHRYPTPDENEVCDNLRKFAASCGESPLESESNPNTNTNPEENASHSCSEPDKPPREPPFITLPLIDGTEFDVSQDEVAGYKKLYPAVDVEQQLRNMRGWCLDNPKRRKTRGGIKRFIGSWLAKEQNRGGQASNSWWKGGGG